MVILHIVAPARAGGLERVVEMLASGQRDAGHAVHVAAVVDVDAADHPLSEPLRRAGVEVHTHPLPSRSYLRERAVIAHDCQTLRPDVAHTHGYRPDVVDAPVARALGIPVVTTVHGFAGGDWKNRLYECLQRRAFRSFDAVVAVSRPLLEYLRNVGVPPERLHLIPNAWKQSVPLLPRVAARAALGLEEERFVVGWVGRLSHEKGPDLFVDALARVADLNLSASVLGAGLEAPALMRRAAALGMNGRIVWHSLVPGAGLLFRAFDAFVLSSRTEGTPIVLFEAMAAGVPIVATRVGGIPGVVSETEALLTPPGDAAALADAIRAVYCDRPGAMARARAARGRLEREFTVEPWLASYEMIYRSLQ